MSTKKYVRPKRTPSKRYTGIYVEIRKHRATGKLAKFFYVRYPKEGKRTFELVGSDVEGWTEAKASAERVKRIEGLSPSNKDRRLQEKAQAKPWTLERLPLAGDETHF